jgi:hypothetical protein
MPATYAAVHAALHEQLKKQAEEEEKMTRYTREDLEQDWEFKIVRSTFGAFRKPRVLQALIEEEALAGWEMVEKFDEYRVRFKRPIRARQGDSLLPGNIDPYRTQYGSFGNRNAMVLIAILAAALLAAGLAFFLFAGL